MTLLGAILVLAAAPAAGTLPLAVEGSEEEIVVIGRKLGDWRGTWGSKKGVLSCKTTRSTGDAEIDAIGCGALVHCAAPLVPQFQAIAGAKVTKAERNRRLDVAIQAMLPCLTEQREAGIAALADKRAGA